MDHRLRDHHQEKNLSLLYKSTTMCYFKRNSARKQRVKGRSDVSFRVNSFRKHNVEHEELDLRKTNAKEALRFIRQKTFITGQEYKEGWISPSKETYE